MMPEQAPPLGEPDDPAAEEAIAQAIDVFERAGFTVTLVTDQQGRS